MRLLQLYLAVMLLHLHYSCYKAIIFIELIIKDDSVTSLPIMLMQLHLPDNFNLTFSVAGSIILIIPFSIGNSIQYWVFHIGKGRQIRAMLSFIALDKKFRYND